MAAKKKSYLYAVQRATGHEVVSATVEGATPPVEAQFLENGQVRLVRDGDVIATSDQIFDNEDEVLTLHKWAADDKTAEPTSSVEVTRS